MRENKALEVKEQYDHAPLPWRLALENADHKLADDWIHLTTDKLEHIVLSHEGNLRFIVKCVNMHDELVAALEECTTSLTAETNETDQTDKYFAIIKRAKQL